MSYPIDVAFEEQLISNLTILTQQKASKLMKACTVRKTHAKHVDFPRLGNGEVSEITTRHAATVLEDLPHSKVRVVLRDFSKATALDQEDDQKTLIEFKSPYVRQLASAHGRKMDDLIITAADAATTVVDNTGATSTEAVANTIDDDFGTGSNNDITVEKLLETRRIYASEEVDLDNEEVFFVLDPISERELLSETQVTSSDYNSSKVLTDGKLNAFLGFQFIMSNRLNTASGVNDVKSLAIVKSGMGLAINNDVSVAIDKRPDLNNLTQVLAKMSAEAVRIEDNKVIVVEAYRA